MRSIQSMSYCVLMPPSPKRTSGVYSISGPAEITTPAACVLALRASPSICFAVSSSLRTAGCVAYIVFNSAIWSIARSMG